MCLTKAVVAERGGGGVGTLEVEGFRELAMTGLLPALADGGGGMICIVTENLKRLGCASRGAQLLSSCLFKLLLYTVL
jgi:hypothetical protein